MFKGRNIKRDNQRTLSKQISALEIVIEESETDQMIEDATTPNALSVYKINSHLREFNSEVSKIFMFPIDCSENYPGNYDRYLNITLKHIASLKDIKFEYASENPKLYEKYPKEIIERIALSDKKLLLIDLDETLIHADFEEKYSNSKEIKYDTIITFNENKNNNNSFIEASFNNSGALKDNGKRLIENENNQNENNYRVNDGNKPEKVGIFIRNGVHEFLEEISKYFEVGIFTGSVPEYADEVINYLDPENKYIKFRLYRNNCINVGNMFRVKDLRILKGFDLKRVVLLDNNMYSFAAQLTNGILINSFYTDKNDTELYNVMGYLINVVLPIEDVREVNEQFFEFKKLVDEFSN